MPHVLVGYNVMNIPWEKILCGDISENQCIRDIAWILPSHLLLAFTCAFYVGKHHRQKCRFLYQSISIRFRIIITCFLFLIPPVRLLVLHYIYNSWFNNIDYLVAFSESSCWLSLIFYLCTLHPVNIHRESQVFINFSFFLCLIASAFNLHVTIINSSSLLADKCFEIFKVIVEAIFAITVIFSRRQELPTLSEFRSLSIAVNESDALISSSFLSYGGFQEVNDPHDLGRAEKSGFFSRLFLCWVKPLIEKGDCNLINTAEDLFDLPDSLLTPNICAKFHRNRLRPSSEQLSNEICNNEQTNENISLLKSFHRTFGLEYYLLGILKLVSDLLSFAGPVLLNLLVSFLEDGNLKNIKEGYLYAAAMFVITLLGTLCSTHYNYIIGRIGLKVRAVLISTIYQKALNVSGTTLSKFSTGEIVNFMSTDTDRMVNFCQSFHQFWSLPIQVALTLYLLYQQIGYTSLLGLGFAIMMIPLNQYIARKIGYYSVLLMQEKDKRIKLMSEILSGIRVVKMHAWEDAFSDKIDSIRQLEMQYLKKRKYLDAFCVYFWATTPVVIAFLSFVTYALLGNTLTASRIFTSIALFNMLIVPLNAFPWVLNGLVEAYISLKRVEVLLMLPDTDLAKYFSEPNEANTKVEVLNGLFSYNVEGNKRSSRLRLNENRLGDDVFFLGPLSVAIPQGKFVCIAGKVGCGKSTFLSSVLGDLSKISGKVDLASDDWSRGIGFVPQEPWIQQTTIRENILFGKTMNSLRYRNVLEACALFDDLKVLPMGDKTEVGERGITLSGGQRARIALARAAYQDVDLYLLDDPIAAVDAHVAEHIFNHCILGLLRNKTRILCTHRMKMVEKADLVIVLEGGKIAKQGPPAQFSQMSFSEPNSVTTIDSLDIDHDINFIDNQLTVELVGENCLVQDEEKDTGIVKPRVYKSYWNAIGCCLSVAVLASCLFMQASRSIGDWWLSYWIAHSSNDTGSTNTSQTVSVMFDELESNTTHRDVKFYLMVYACLAAANNISSLIRAFSFAYCGLKAAKNIHSRLKSHIIKATMNFFCMTPLGRILNRFSTDVYTIDDNLPFMLNILLAQTFGLIGCLAITVYSLPFILIILIPLAVIYYRLQGYYRNTSRELKRISSLTLSPIYAHFSESLCGHSTIRALAAVSRFEQDNILKLDANQQAVFATFAASQWLNMRLQLIGLVFVSGIAIISVIQHEFEGIDPGLVGLALSYALSVTALLNGFVSAFTETEKEMISVERVIQYIENVPSEIDRGVIQSSFSWPSHGIVTFRDVCLQYDPNSAYALEFVSFETKRAEKLGIVGRTGSGKSSLIQALFRMVDINHGKILIDGMDISRLWLKVLRSQLAVVPQEPFLFSGTIRDNIDPSVNHSDSDIWRALGNCYMNQKVQELGGLEAKVEEKGRNFSAGERQLLCLTRTLLNKAKILCLDEATASIDQQTDSLLQLTIRMAFRHTTIFIIAHRMETVMDCDRVMVMSHGKIVELDKPSVLLANSSSEFFKLVHGIQR